MKIDSSIQLGDVEASYLRDEKTASIYVFRINDVPVLRAEIDNTDPTLTIFLRRPEGGELLTTNGRAQRALHEVEASDGGEVPDGLADHIDGMTVYQYVVPRLLRFVTELYVNQV